MKCVNQFSQEDDRVEHQIARSILRGFINEALGNREELEIPALLDFEWDGKRIVMALAAGPHTAELAEAAERVIEQAAARVDAQVCDESGNVVISPSGVDVRYDEKS